MILLLENIGKIKKAEIDIKGITIIAGENNTGKSTVGKVLYSIFNSFYDIKGQIYQQKRATILNALTLIQMFNLGEKSNSFRIDDLTDIILRKEKEYIKTPDMLAQDVYNFIVSTVNKEIDISSIEDILERIMSILKLKDKDFFNKVITDRFNKEFSAQINNIYTKERASVQLNVQNYLIDITIKDNSVRLISEQKLLNTEAIYIDDPFILDDVGSMYFYDKNKRTNERKLDLSYKLYYKNDKKNTIDEMILEEKLNKIYKQLNIVCEGTLEESNSGVGYKKLNSNETLDVRNISTGLKTFVILKTLLQKGWIEEKGTIILDEPEIHLHPEWQLLLARLIVLLQKELNMHILLNTHSPYFLNAIEVYSLKYNVDNKCKYYLASEDEENKSVIIEDVSNYTEAIYKKLAKPLQDLEDERYAK